MKSIFISFGFDNTEDAKYLTQQLEKKGFSIWDVTDQSTTNRLEGVKTCGVLVVLMTPLASRSARVQRETLYAANLHKPVLPVLVKGDIFPEYRDLPYIDMRDGVSVPGAMVKMLKALLESGDKHPSTDEAEAELTTLGQPEALRELAKMIRSNLGGNQPRGITQEMQSLLPRDLE